MKPRYDPFVSDSHGIYYELAVDEHEFVCSITGKGMVVENFEYDPGECPFCGNTLTRQA